MSRTDLTRDTLDLPMSIPSLPSHRTLALSREESS